MNKYEEAIELIKESYAENTIQYGNDEISYLSELVERATPKKPILAPNGNSESVRECPNCHCRRSVSLDTRYCDWCGQALKWERQ